MEQSALVQRLSHLPVEPNPVTPATAAAPPGDAVGQLERLSALRDKGAITNEEFARMKTTLVPAAAETG